MGNDTLTLDVTSSASNVDSMKTKIEQPGRPRMDRKVSIKYNNGTEQAAWFWETLSFWCGEIVEVAFFGPYTEPRP
jgi:hypothetical protein